MLAASIAKEKESFVSPTSRQKLDSTTDMYMFNAFESGQGSRTKKKDDARSPGEKFQSNLRDTGRNVSSKNPMKF